MTNHDEARYGELLRQVLAEEADTMVMTGDGLSRIRERTAHQHRLEWWRRPALALASVAVVAAAAGVGIGVLVATDEPDEIRPPITGGTTSSPSEPAPASPTGEPSTGPTSGALTVPVYYLMETDVRGPKLYREFRQAPDRGGPISTALDVMLHEPALDPDYASLWPKQTQVLDVAVTGDLATIDLSRESLDGNAGSAYESLSMQQLVYTVTAAEPAVKRVQLTVEGQPVDSMWGHVDANGPMERASHVDVLGAVWISDPQEGATVARTFRFGGQATVFEATVSWLVLQGDTVVKEGFTNASVGGPGRGDWSAEVTLAPGSYTIRAFESSAKDGTPMFIDDKSVTVE